MAGEPKDNTEKQESGSGRTLARNHNFAGCFQDSIIDSSGKLLICHPNMST